MTIDKIKHYMKPEVFSHWINCGDIQAIQKAKNDLKKEIESGLLKGIEYIAELNLLTYLSK
jgi:hypothetical protein